MSCFQESRVLASQVEEGEEILSPEVSITVCLLLRLSLL